MIKPGNAVEYVAAKHGRGDMVVKQTCDITPHRAAFVQSVDY